MFGLGLTQSWPLRERATNCLTSALETSSTLRCTGNLLSADHSCLNASWWLPGSQFLAKRLLLPGFCMFKDSCADKDGLLQAI